MIQSPVCAAGSLLMTGRADWPGLLVKPPPFTGKWDDQEEHYVVLDLQGAEYNVDVYEKVPGAVPLPGRASPAGDEP